MTTNVLSYKIQSNAASTRYSINYCSPLNRLEGFHAVGGQIPQDIMHVLFEGVFHFEVQLLLKHLILVEGHFTLDILNSRIESFAYSRKETKSRSPKSLLLWHIVGKGKLPLSGIIVVLNMHDMLSVQYSAASQMWTFVTLLPLFVGDLVPLEHPHWECFLLLLEIMKQCTARLTSVAASAIMIALVDQHHNLFKTCYPDVRLTPKMHYMVHFSSQILE